jgi:beta-aspartyl-peptidase (threonine type)
MYTTSAACWPALRDIRTGASAVDVFGVQGNRFPAGPDTVGPEMQSEALVSEKTMILLANEEGRVGITAAVHALKSGWGCIAALETGIRLVEADPTVRSVGRGGWPNILGSVELDAAVMDGNTLRSGAVGALSGYLHPVSVARAVLETLPHEMLVGEGAARFAQEIGAERDSNLTEASKCAWKKQIARFLKSTNHLSIDEIPLADLSRRCMDPELVRDTTVFLGRDMNGGLATATSTSGWAWKYPGRLGDSPIIGAGSYADTQYGAAACTHTGEMAIRAGTSRSIVLYLKMGMSLDEAMSEAANDLGRLKGGQLGGLVLHGLDAHGSHRVVAVNCDDEIRYWVWTPDLTAPELRVAHPVSC